jgi:tRNA pseudouridine55 synthase
LDIADIRLPYVHFKVSCSAGTYIRTLCADIGRKLGCGGHLIGLRRTASGDFTIEQAVDLGVLQEMAAQGRALGAMIPMAEALGRMPTLIADTQTLEVIRHGRPLPSDWLRAGLGEHKDPSGINGFLKVVDVHQELKAVIQKAGNGMRYNYCCVFH